MNRFKKRAGDFGVFAPQRCLKAPNEDSRGLVLVRQPGRFMRAASACFSVSEASRRCARASALRPRLPLGAGQAFEQVAGLGAQQAARVGTALATGAQQRRGQQGGMAALQFPARCGDVAAAVQFAHTSRSSRSYSSTGGRHRPGS